MTSDGFFPDQRTPGAVEQLLKDALTEDPDFVWAHILLAHAVYVQGRNSEVIPHLERAVAAAAPGVDRYIAEGDLLGFRGDFAADPVTRNRYYVASLAKFDAALQLQPDHFWALSCVTNITRNKLGQRPDPRLLRRFVEARPNSVPTLALASRDALGAGYVADAREYARRGRAILDAPGAAQNQPHSGLLRLFPIYDAMRQKNYSQALQEADVILYDPRLASGEIGVGYSLFYLYLRLGQWDRIDELASRMVPAITGSRFLIVAAGERGGPNAVRELMTKHMAKYNEVIGGSSVLGVAVVSVLVDAGMLDFVRKTNADLKRSAHAEGPMMSQFIEGLLASADGRLTQAIPLFERTIREHGPRSHIGALASLKLAEARIASGDSGRAIALLEEAVRQSSWEATPASLNRVQYQLAQLYRQVGRTSEADAIEADLRQILATAPDAHPIKRRLVGAAASR